MCMSEKGVRSLVSTGNDIFSFAALAKCTSSDFCIIRRYYIDFSYIFHFFFLIVTDLVRMRIFPSPHAKERRRSD